MREGARGRSRLAKAKAALTRLALDRASGALFDYSTRILFHFVVEMLTPHPPGK
ncbi:MAG: hypothetical protein GY847_09530 [Proteobacteria bacterium]|nr:hypothetical protein [Pseudomonadota bacterium]